MIYLIKSTICMALFWGFYHIMLKKESTFAFNRFYLLGSLLLSLIIPKLSFFSKTIDKTLPLIPFEYDTELIIPKDNQTDYTLIIWGVYGLITAFFLFKYGKGLQEMIQRIRLNEVVKYNHLSSVVLIPEPIQPQTFFGYIFLNKQDYLNQTIDDSIFNHEMAHAKQLHSIDVVLVELIRAIFWCNPLIILYARAIRENHEFLADQSALNHVDYIPDYQNLLLNSLQQQQLNNPFSSSINYSLTKNRFIMMTRKTPLKTAFLKSGSACALLLASMFVFSSTAFAQEQASPEEIREYHELVLDNYDQEGNPLHLSKDEAKRMLTIYNKMDKGQQTVIKELRLPIPEQGKIKYAKDGTMPPPPPFPQGCRYFIDGKEVSVFEANMMLPNYKLYKITRKKGKNGAKDEFHMNKKSK